MDFTPKKLFKPWFLIFPLKFWALINKKKLKLVKKKILKNFYF